MRDFFCTDCVPTSAAVLALMLDIGVFQARFFLRRMHEGKARARANL